MAGGFQIDVEIRDRELRELLARVRTRLGNMTPAMEEIGEIVRTSVERNFKAGGRPEAWTPSVRSGREGGKPLSDTGRLSNSITVEADDNSARIGTNLLYAAIHQFGGVIRPKRGAYLYIPSLKRRVRQVVMPKREFLLVQAEDWGSMTAALARRLGL